MWPRWKGRVAAFIHSSGIGAHSVDDILGEVLVVAWRRVADLPADPDEAVRWLIGVARRVTWNHRRSEARRAALAARVEQEVAAHVSRTDQQAVLKADILDGWRRLSKSDQLALLLTGWHGLTVSEIATVLGCSTDAAAKRLVRARKRLREAIEQRI